MLRSFQNDYPVYLEWGAYTPVYKHRNMYSHTEHCMGNDVTEWKVAI